MAHIANLCVKEAFGRQLIACKFWPQRSPDMNLWGTLKARIYMNTRHTIKELTIFKGKLLIFPDKLCYMFKNILGRCKAYFKGLSRLL